jgi:uncharacterized protein
MAFLDTSVLGSYYCPEPLSEPVNRAMQSVSDAVISPFVELEFCSMLSQKVRMRSLSRAAAGAAMSQFRVHVADQIYRVVQIGAREYELAHDWLVAFTTPVRTLDALHLAASFAHEQTLITTDKGLAQAAKRLRVAYELIE